MSFPNSKTNTGTAAQTTAQTVRNVTEKIPFLKKVGEKSGTVGIVMVIAVVLVILVIVLVYLYKLLVGNDLKESLLLDKIVSLEKRESLPIKVSSTKLASTTRGQEFAYSFWIYLQDYYEASTANKLVFTRGNNSTSFSIIDSNANPIVLMDSQTNKMYIAMATTLAGSGTVSVNDIVSPSSGYLVATIDYVPLQRWVHVVLVLKDGNLMIFMDGELYTIKGVHNLGTNRSKTRPFVKGTTGEVSVGSPTNPIQGFMGKFQFFNYALSAKDIKKVYQAGPISKSWLAYFGMGNYSLRNPIYEIK
jgi:hypothetical protein